MNMIPLLPIYLQFIDFLSEVCNLIDHLIWIVADVHMPVLFVRDGDRGVGSAVGQSPNSCHGVVHFSNPLLISLCSLDTCYNYSFFNIIFNFNYSKFISLVVLLS